MLGSGAGAAASRGAAAAASNAGAVRTNANASENDVAGAELEDDVIVRCSISSFDSASSRSGTSILKRLLPGVVTGSMTGHLKQLPHINTPSRAGCLFEILKYSYSGGGLYPIHAVVNTGYRSLMWRAF